MKERPRPVKFLVRALIFGVLTSLAAYFGYEVLGRAFSILQSERFNCCTLISSTKSYGPLWLPWFFVMLRSMDQRTDA